MKNKLFKFFLLFLLISNISFAEDFRFETSEIKVLNSGNLILTKEGKAFSIDGNLEIDAKKFEFNKSEKILKAFNGTAYFRSDNLKIDFDELISNQLTLITTAKKNVKIFDLNKQVSINTDLVTFDKNRNILESSTPSIIKDKIKNILNTNYFNYNLNNNIVKIQDANFKDINNNNFYIELAYLNTISNKLIGKDVVVDLNNKSFDNNNEPRIKGRSITYENEKTEITKGVFTTCKKTDECPPWQLSAEKVQHDPVNQVINYKNAFLKVYDVPVMYFPKFFHPDPTVKRKSGFLTPSIQNSTNSGNFVSLPYFSAISQNKDLTFSPRLYFSEKILLQTEYRQENKNSSHISDVAILKETDKDSKTHFFYKYNRLLDVANFEDSNIDFKIEKTSNDTYLKNNKLVSPIINNYDIMENTFALNLYSSDLTINSEVKVYEDLSKEISSDRYEFILPKLNIIKKIDNKTNLDGNFLLKSNNIIRSYQTNILEKININNFIFNSIPKISQNGFYNNYDFIIKNVNSTAENSKTYKKDENYYMSGLFQFNSSLPLIKEKNNIKSILKPKLALKMSPDFTKDLSKKDGNRIDVNNIYNLNRLATNETLEGGESLTFGSDFSIFDQNISREVFALNLANSLRLQKNDDLPNNNQIGSKNSNFFGEIMLSPNEMLTTRYEISTKNNLTDINYENLVTEISINNFVTTFDYLNENNTLNESSYLTNTTKYMFDKTNTIQFSTRENKSSNLTEYYNLMYEYKNDCLAASIEYNKDYYNDRDVKPAENLFFKLTIIPFGETSSPNLRK